MATFLLTWDGSEDGYPSDEYAADVATTASGTPVPAQWSMGSRRHGASPGDEVYLLRQHERRGLVAAGHLDDGRIYAAPHWARRGETAFYADLSWDRVVPVDDRVTVEALKRQAPGHDWDHVLSSGQRLDEATARVVAGLWTKAAPSRRAPDWTWDETVLAYDLYLREYTAGLRSPSRAHPAVQALSDVLRGLPLHPVDVRGDPTFRNPAGVARKVQNLQWNHTDGQHGAEHGSQTDRRVVSDLKAGDVPALAAAILAAAEQLLPGPTLPPPEDGVGDSSAFEGALLRRWHTSRERDRRLVEQKKARVLRSGAKLECEGCGLDIASVYDLHEGAAVECHHRLPLANGERVTRLSDLAIVCPTCHRALHSRERWPSVEALRRHLESAAGEPSR